MASRIETPTIYEVNNNSKLTSRLIKYPEMSLISRFSSLTQEMLNVKDIINKKTCSRKSAFT